MAGLTKTKMQNKSAETGAFVLLEDLQQGQEPMLRCNFR